MIVNKCTTDYLGNTFPSKAAMLKHYGIDYTTFKYRLEKMKMSLEDALTAPKKNNQSTAIECQDHLGNTFKSKAEMCDYWRIPRMTFFRRIRDGWSIEKALTTPIRRTNPSTKTIKDHLGNEFATIDEMCKHHNITKQQYMLNIRNNCDMEQALTSKTKIGVCADHKGNKYKSINEMCRHYNITKTVLRSRIELGWTLKEILENPSKKCNYEKIKDHKGNEYDCIKSMCEHYGISDATFKNRRQAGMSIQESLSVRNKHNVLCKDHLGNEFGSVHEMCLFWNIAPSTFYGRRDKLKWDIEQTLTKISPKEYNSFGPNLSIIKQIQNKYYEICLNGESYIWHENKIYDYYRKNVIYAKSGIKKIIKSIDGLHYEVETKDGITTMQYPELLRKLKSARR